jgi:hypothetical protein
MMNEETKYVTPDALERFLRTKGIAVDHCHSCHTDDYSYMAEIYFSKGRYSIVCCGMHEAFDKL